MKSSVMGSRTCSLFAKGNASQVERSLNRRLLSSSQQWYQRGVHSEFPKEPDLGRRIQPCCPAQVFMSDDAVRSGQALNVKFRSCGTNRNRHNAFSFPIAALVSNKYELQCVVVHHVVIVVAVVAAVVVVAVANYLRDLSSPSCECSSQSVASTSPSKKQLWLRMSLSQPLG